MADEQPEFGEPWTVAVNSTGVCGFADRNGNAPLFAEGDYITSQFKNGSEIVARVLACVNFLAGIPTLELERLMALRADEQLRKDIRGAYAASRWLDSGEGP